MTGKRRAALPPSGRVSFPRRWTRRWSPMIYPGPGTSSSSRAPNKWNPMLKNDNANNANNANNINSGGQTENIPVAARKWTILWFRRRGNASSGGGTWENVRDQYCWERFIRCLFHVIRYIYTYTIYSLKNPFLRHVNSSLTYSVSPTKLITNVGRATTCMYRIIRLELYAMTCKKYR